MVEMYNVNVLKINDNNDIDMKPIYEQPQHGGNFQRNFKFRIPLPKKQNTEKYKIKRDSYSAKNKKTNGGDKKDKIIKSGKVSKNKIKYCSTDVENLEKQYREGPFDFDIICKLFHAYRHNGIKENLSQIRETIIIYCPLSDKLWTEWLKDLLVEIKNKQNNSFEERYKVIKRFKLAFEDFYCKILLMIDFKLCKKFLKELTKLHNEATDQVEADEYEEIHLENIRKYFEDFLTLWGFDFSRSAKLYDLYTEFEKNNLKKFIAINDELNIQSTTNLIRRAYQTRLSYPHIDHDLVWPEYCQWETNKAEIDNISNSYENSIKNVNIFLTFEEDLNACLKKVRKHRKKIYKLVFLLKKELPKISKIHFNYILVYMERVLEDFYDSDELWLLYIDFINKNNNDNMKMAVLKRATRCNYSFVDVWKLLFNEMERQGASLNEIEGNVVLILAHVERSFNYEDDEFNYEIWKSVLELYIRKFDNTLEQLHFIRNYFKEAIEDISSKFKILKRL
jgi:hypothetical protein